MTTSDARREAALRLRNAFATTSGRVWLRFQGRSMAPTLRDGDLLCVRHVAPGDLAAGDIVVFEAAHANIVHRLLFVRRRHTSLITKGDNAWRADRPFGPDRLVGKICTVRRGGAYIDLERGGWPWLARAIALASLIEAIAFRSAAAAHRRWLPRGLVRRGVERRLLRLLGRGRRAVIGALLRTLPRVEAR